MVENKQLVEGEDLLEYSELRKATRESPLIIPVRYLKSASVPTMSCTANKGIEESSDDYGRWFLDRRNFTRKPRVFVSNINILSVEIIWIWVE